MIQKRMNPFEERNANFTRRQFFGKAAAGIGGAALASILYKTGFASPQKILDAPPGLPDLTHFAPKAKRIIYLFQNGAPTHVDLFDYKPKLREWAGKQIPDEVVGGKRFSTMTSGQTDRPVLPEISQFAQHGASGAWVSDLMPHIAEIADDLCFIKSMHTEAVNDAPAITYFLSGDERPGRPSMGAWLSYGLGTSNRSLPTFCVLVTKDKGGQPLYARLSLRRIFLFPVINPAGCLCHR